MNTTAKTNTSTVAELIDEGHFCPPVMIKWDKDDILKYAPISFKKDLIKYDLTMSQEKYSDGKLGRAWIHMTPDNEINSRFEILDL